MFDPVATQNDLVAMLLSSPAIANVNVKSFRKMRIQQELDMHTILTAGRNGKVGAAAVVLQPYASPNSPNATGPVLTWHFPIVCYEMPQVNDRADIGTLMSSEVLGQNVLDIVHQYVDEKVGVLSVDGNALAPENEYTWPGTVAYRATFVTTPKTQQTLRASIGVISVAGGMATISTPSNAVPGTYVKYTTDGSTPGDDQAGNQGSLTYSGPFSVVSGDVIRAVAYAPGYNFSQLRYYLVP